MPYDPLKSSKPKKRKPAVATPESGFAGERIAKRLARAGICSRRDAERLIAEGRVAVDGKVIKSPALNVTEAQTISVDGQDVAAPAAARLWRYHKTQGVITTARDPQGRPTVFEKLPPELPRVVTVGRLDFNTEGLLLLTNDGGLARHLELPQNAWLRHYRVRVHGDVDMSKLTALANGVTISGIHYEPIKAELEKAQGSNAWLNVTIREGKNREVRKIMDYLGLQVTRLIRVSFGPFQLGKLEKGAVEEVPRHVLRTQLSNYLKDK